jgi:hypothetical protein
MPWWGWLLVGLGLSSALSAVVLRRNREAGIVLLSFIAGYACAVVNLVLLRS